MLELGADRALDQVISLELVLIHLYLRLMLTNVSLACVHQLLYLLNISYRRDLLLKIFDKFFRLIFKSLFLP